MFEESLWYLIIIGGFGLVLVFVGCFIVPIISFLFRWRYPPLSEEEELRLKDASDRKLQALLQLLEKNAVDVSDVDLNRVPQKNGETSNNDSEPHHSSESDNNTSLSSLSNKPSSKRRSIRDYVCTTISTAVMNEKPSSYKSSQAQHANLNNSSSKSTDGVLNENEEGEHDVETGTRTNRANTNEQEKGNGLVEQSRISHASLNSHHHGNNHHSCAICLEEYHQHHQADRNKNDDGGDEEEEEKVICATGGCIHCFHSNCMKSLIRSRARKGIYEVVPCPICRLPFLAPSSWNMQLLTCQGTNTHQQQNENADSNGEGVVVGSATTRAVPVPITAIGEEASSTSTENVISVPVVSVSLPLTLADQEAVSPPASIPSSQSMDVANSNPKEDFNADDSFVNNATTGTSRLPESAGGTPPKNRKGKRKSNKKYQNRQARRWESRVQYVYGKESTKS